MDRKHIVIVSGGALDDAFVRETLKKIDYDYCIACDKGIEFFQRNRMTANLILGDFDSAGEAVLREFRENTSVEMEQYPPEKDWTDTELAIRRAMDFGATQIDLFGATGTRIDHVLGNIHLLAMGLDRGVLITIQDSHNRVRLFERSVTLTREEAFGNYVSLIPFAGTVEGLTIRGLKYELSDAVLLPGRTIGISNEFVAPKAEITFDRGRLLVIESRD